MHLHIHFTFHTDPRAPALRIWSRVTSPHPPFLTTVLAIKKNHHLVTSAAPKTLKRCLASNIRDLLIRTTLLQSSSKKWIKSCEPLHTAYMNWWRNTSIIHASLPYFPILTRDSQPIGPFSKSPATNPVNEGLSVCKITSKASSSSLLLSLSPSYPRRVTYPN